MTFVSRINHTGGSTAVFEASVEPGEPVLGVDPEIQCACRRLVGLEWISALPLSEWCGPGARSLLKVLVTEN